MFPVPQRRLKGLAVTQDEKNELRDLLADGLDKSGLDLNAIISMTDGPLDEDSGPLYVTHPELTVFRLDEKLLPKLIYAYSVYEDFIDITCPSFTQGRCYELVVKARDICPGYQHRAPSPKTFQWFAEFFDIPHRQAYAYFMKREFNLMKLITFDDERHEVDPIFYPCPGTTP